MKRAFYLLLVFTLAKAASAQTIAFTPKWQQGDAFNYLFFKEKYTLVDSNYVQNTDTVMLKMRVIKADTASGYELELNYNFSKAKPKNHNGLKKLVEDNKKTLLLSLDKEGSLTGLKNWAEIKTAALKEADELRKKATGSDTGTWTYLKTKLQTREQVENLFLEDLNFFFMLYSSVLEVNNRFAYEDEMANPVSPQPIPATGEISLEADAENPAQVVAKIYVLPDEERGADVLKGIVNFIRLNEGNSKAPADQLFGLQDSYLYRYRKNDGVLTQAIYTRYLKQGMSEQVEALKYILAK